MLELLTTRWPLKLLALGFAIAIWLAVTGEDKVIQTFDVPLDIDLGEEVVLTGPPLSMVNVTVRGPESLVRDVNPLRLAFNVDLLSAAPGERSVLLTSDRLSGLPKGVEIRRIDPDRIELELGRRLRRVLTVVPFFLGEPAEGFQIYDYRVLPDTLEVDGPERDVRKLERLRTEPIRLDGRDSSFSIRVGVVPESPAVGLVNPRRPEVRVDIDRAPVESVFDEVAIVPLGAKTPVEIKPRTVSVTLAAPPDLLRRITPEQVRAWVDVTGLAPQAETLQLPLRVEVLRVPPRDNARITVKTISRREAAVRILEPQLERPGDNE